MRKSVITELSKRAFGLLIVMAVFGATLLSILFLNLEKLNKRIVDSKEMHNLFLDVENSTHGLLSSSYLRDSVKELNEYVALFNEKLISSNIEHDAAILDDWSICLEEFKAVNELVSHEYFDDKHLKNRPLLRVEGELFHFSSYTQFYNEISTLIDSIEYILQYETFILENYKKQNIKNNLMQKNQVQQIKSYATIVALVFLVFLVLISIYTVKIISRNEMKIIETTEELESGLQKLDDSRRFVKNIIDNAPVRIFWKDVNSVFIGANKLFLEDANLKDEQQLIGTTESQQIWKHNAESFLNDDKTIIQSKKPKLKYEETVINNDGSVKNIVTSKIPLLDENNKVVGILGIYDDVTEQKRLQAEVSKKESMLVQQSRLAQMGEMISMIAHQWRQPLGAISATAIDLKMKSALGHFNMEQKEEAKKYEAYVNAKIENIEEFVQNLTTIIDDFRNFYKPNKEQVNTKLKDVILKSLTVIKTSILNNNIKLIEEYDDNEDIKLYDSEMMQVILNILKNAQDNFLEKKIKDPYIKISSKNRSISICDNGGGITEDIIGEIFDPYFSTKDIKNGTGLGLYMSKIIVEEHHNGKLTAQNNEDGVCFEISL